MFATVRGKSELCLPRPAAAAALSGVTVVALHEVACNTLSELRGVANPALGNVLQKWRSWGCSGLQSNGGGTCEQCPPRMGKGRGTGTASRLSYVCDYIVSRAVDKGGPRPVFGKPAQCLMAVPQGVR